MSENYKKYMYNNAKKALKTNHSMHGYITYSCSKCKSAYVMLIEKGLEDFEAFRKNQIYKPIPYSFPCLCCGDGMVTPVSKIKYWRTVVDYRDYIKSFWTTISHICTYQNFFWNDPEKQCGVPIIVNVDYSLHMMNSYENINKDIEKNFKHVLEYDEDPNHFFKEPMDQMVQYCKADIDSISELLNKYDTGMVIKNV